MKNDPRDTNHYFYTIRPRILKLARGKCYACFRRVGPGTKRNIWQCHHILPVSRGGTNDLNNLVCLCLKCHELVHAGDIRYKQKLAKREYFIGRDIDTGKRVVRWWGYRWVYRKRKLRNPRLRRLRKLALDKDDADRSRL